MAYPLDSRGLDPSMQRIIEAAEAGNDDELLPNASLGRPAVPDAQAPLTSSRHINNGSSLQDAYQASPPVHSSLSRQPIQPTQLDYHVQPYSIPRQPLQPSFTPRATPRTATGASRLSLTPRSLQVASEPSFYNNDLTAIGTIRARPHDFVRASTLANLRTQPQPMRYAEPRQPAVDTTSFHVGSSRYGMLQPQQQQPTPPLHLNVHPSIHSDQKPTFTVGTLFTPPEQRSSSPELGLSSPTRRVVANRENRLTLPSSQRMKDDIALHTPARPTFGGMDFAQESSAPKPALNQALPTINDIQLISTRDLPDRFRPVFPFPLFNAIQSKVFPSVYGTNDNVVVSAPTGGGKTAILELAIVKLIETNSSGQFKIVYQAPTKSLCSERARDWTAKFGAMNYKTAELTGDTDAAELRKVGDATIIVTTPEKWDSITRKWKDHIKLLQLVKLFLIDEVHILKEDRGATLEAVVSRMKSIGASVRFVALSATVPNSHDIAIWLGRDHTNGHLRAHRETFGEEFRPVKLQKHVHGFESSGNDYAFDSALIGKLPALIEKYTHKKPMMVFCFTRKSCENTAIKLAEWWASLRPTERAWPPPTERVPVSTKDLNDLVTKGVAYHHAGLDPADRMAIERGYLKGQLNVICCTSTLAVGVNLPCHLVVLKGTVGYQNGQLTEYSDLEIMQMLGRAGRPQFDDSAVAIIMTSKANVDRYTKMISGQDVLESTLHNHLIEHLNSEIGLGTVRDLHSAKTWLGGTFLSVRMKQNPKYYKFNCDTGSRNPDERLELVCERDIRLLQNTKLITSEARFTCTKYGEAMSKYMVKFETMQLLLSIPEHATMSQILDVVSQASEFKDLKMKAGERAHFRELNKSPFIKWPIKETVIRAAHKISLIVQVQLGGVDLPNEKDFNRRQYMTEQSLVFDRIQRLVRCVVDCKAFNNDAVATQNALELSRSIAAQYWEHLPNQLRQVSSIGPAAVRKLVTAGVSSVDSLLASDSATIERIMSRNPPYGHKVLESLKDFPRLTLKADIIGRTIKAGQSPQLKIRATLGMKNQKAPYWNRQTVSLTFMAGVSNGSLAHFWRGTMKKLEKGFEFYFFAELLSPSDAVSCFLACGDIVGTVKSVILSHDIQASAFPVPKIAMKDSAKPLQSIETSDEFYYDDGFDWDGITAKELEDGIETARKEVSKEHHASNEDDDEFLDIDDVLAKPYHNAGGPVPPQQPEPVQMANGKWMCNHVCRDGQKTKHGTICKHKCCRDGLNKPRKLQLPRKQKAADAAGSQKKVESKAPQALPETRKPDPRNTNLKVSRPENEFASLGRIEVLDLSQVLDPIPYEDIAPREYRKLHALHNQTAASEPVPTLRKVKPTANYGSGTQPFASFIQGNMQPVAQKFPREVSSSKPDGFATHTVSPKSGWMSMDDEEEDDNELPSPSKVIPYDPFVTDEATQSAYSGFTADLKEDESSYMAYGDEVPQEYYQQENDIQPAAGTSFINDIVDYDAYTTAEPSLSSHTLSMSPEQDDAVGKRKVGPESDDRYYQGEKKARLSEVESSEEVLSGQGDDYDAGSTAGAHLKPSEQLPPFMQWRKDWMPAPRPLWLQEIAKIHPDFVAYFEFPGLSFESDEEAAAAEALKIQKTHQS